MRALESCRGLPGGLVRALRAELSFSCAEELARDGLGNGTPLEPRYQHALAGLLLAARLLQRADPPPAFRPRTTSAEAGVSFVEQVLVPWGQGAEQRLAELERQVLALPEVSYGGALARIARAVARKRFRGVYGSFQTPREYKARYDLRAPLYASVDESYLPFVAAEHQAVRDGWSALAVSSSVWLSKPFVAHELFEGREHSLLRLLLSQPPGVASEEHGARLALSVPPFYLADLLSEAELQQASTLEAAALRGLSPRVRALLHGRQLSPAAQLALARSELMVSFLSIDPMRARRVVALTADIPGDDAALMGALAASFASVPADHRAWQGTQAFPVDLTPLTAPRSKARTTIGLSSLNAVYLLTAAGELSPELVSGLLERATENLEPAIAQACWPFTHWFSDSLRERPRCPCPYRWVR